jgi:hypothetical protein
VRTRGAVAAAAAAGWLLVAVHPYGVVPAFVALVAAAVIWRGRGLRSATPVAIATIAAVPFLAADFRLADRSAVGSEGKQLASPGEAWDQLVAAVSAFAGGDGLPLLFFAALALVGLVVLVRREAAVAALAFSMAIPPLLFVLVRTDTAPDLSPRHLFFGLPLWAAAIGIGASTLARRSSLVLALIALVAVVSPASALQDPREFGFGSASPDEAPTIHAGESDLLLPYSAVFLAAFPHVSGALALPHGPGDEIRRALEHAHEPVGAVYLAVPTKPWTVRRLEGPFDKPGALSAAAETVNEYEDAPQLSDWREWIEPGLCEALRKLDRACP